MDKNMIVKKDAVKLIKKRLLEKLKPLGFQSHPRSKSRYMRIRGELIDEVSLRTDGYHLELWFFMYYRRAPFACLKLDEGRLWRIMKAQENISTYLCWHGEFLESSEQKNYCYKEEHFEAVWQEMVLALEQYVLPYMEKMSVEKLLTLMVKRGGEDEEFFRVNQTVFFHDKYFRCMSEAAVYGVGMWVLGNYTEGLPYIIFAQNKYRHWMEGREQETEHSFRCKGRTLEILDNLIEIYEMRREELGMTVQKLTNQISENWADYMS